MSNEVNFWDNRYRENDYAYGVDPSEIIAKNINLIKPKAKILSLAEGEGRNAVYLAKFGFNVTAVDFSQQAKQKALSLAKKENVDIVYEVGNLENFDIGVEKWDCIISIFCHTGLELRKNLFTKINDGIKQGGLFIFQGYNINQLKNNSGGPKNEDILFNIKELNDHFSNFNHTIKHNIAINLNEGKYHNGKSDILQFIATKDKISTLCEV